MCTNLKSQKDHGAAAKGNDGSSQSVGIAFEKGKPDLFQAEVGQADHHAHGGDGGQAEGHDHQDYPAGIELGSRVHEDRDEGLAGPQHKDDKQPPERGVFFLMDMGVVPFVIMTVFVYNAVQVSVGMGVDLALDSPPDAPGHVGQAES